MREMRTLTFLVLMMCGLRAAPAQDTGHVLRLTNKIEVRPDGGSEQQIHVEIAVESEDAKRKIAIQGFNFAAGFETISFLGGYTKKADGHEFHLSSDAAHLYPAKNSVSTDKFLNRWIMEVAFPSVAVGDTVVVNWKRTSKSPLPPNFMWSIVYPRSTVWDEATVTLSTPASMVLNILAQGVEHSVSASSSERIEHQWTYKSAPGEITPPGRIFVSTFPTWEAFGHSYYETTSPRLETNEAIETLASSLTQNAVGTLEKTKTLYDWIATNIALREFYVADQNIIARNVAETFANRWGDCKDQAALFIVLLGSQHIEANMVLLRVGTSTELPKVPLVGAFNHVIVYVPSLRLYLDTTAHVPFGELLNTEYQHLAVHATPAGQVDRIPLSRE
jgi:hypothetical protein